MARAVVLAVLFSDLAAPAEVPGRQGQTLILTDGVSTVYAIEDNLVVRGTDSVFVAGVPLERSQYALDYEHALIQFWTRLPAWTPVLVSYRTLALPGQPLVYRLHTIVESKSDTTANERVVARVDTTEPLSGGGLDVSGSKTVGISFGGTEGAGMDQATRVALTGELEGVAVEAELSDQSSPIAPEGTTRNIEELDKLLITLRGDRWRGSFGDVDLAVPAGDFGSIQRRAVGAVASGSVGPAEVTAGYATPRGQFGSVVLGGVDGSQGPYILAPDGRSAQIVPGSEEVYLDGMRVVRGWDADYTIDYSSGELVFTSRHIVNRDSRIEARFQYVTGAYERSSVLGSAYYRPAGFDVGVGFFREGDDPDRSLIEGLTPEQRAFLSTIGSDTALAWVKGDTEVGQGRGDYVKDGDHFRFAGLDSGDFQVRFTLAGDGQGDYVYDDTLLAYRYAGPGQGNYVARVRVVLPERDELAYGRAGYAANGLSVRAEGAFQRRSLNLFAPGRGAEGSGALNLDAGWQDSSFGVDYRRRMQGNGFDLPGSAPSVDFAYQWGGTSEQERRLTDELAVRLSPFRFAGVQGEAGRLQRTDGRLVTRLGGSARLGFLNYEGGLAGSIMRHKIALTPAIRSFYPKTGWQSETRDTERIRGWTLGADLNPGQDWSAGTELDLSDRDRTDSVTGAWKRESRGRLLQARGEWSAREALHVEAMAALQDRRFDRSAEQDWSQLLGSLNSAFTPRAGLRLQADFSQSYSRVQLKDELFHFVGAGNGEYHRDSVTGQYIPDPEGDYERLTVATGRFAAAREWTFTGYGDISAFSPAGLTGSYSQTQARTDSGVLTDQARADARLTLHLLEPVLSPTLGANRDFSLDRTLAATGKDTRHQQAYAELYSDRLPGIEARARVEFNSARRLVNVTQAEYEEDGWRAELSPVVGQRLRLELTGAYERDAMSEPVSYPELGRFTVTAYTAGVARTLSIGGRSRVRGSIDVTRRLASVLTLPFDVALYDPLGWSPSVDVDFEHAFSTVLSASARYGFSKRSDRPAEHRFSSELRAYF